MRVTDARVAETAHTLSSIATHAPFLCQRARCVFSTVAAPPPVRRPAPVNRAAAATLAERDRKKLVGRWHLVGHLSRTLSNGDWVRALEPKRAPTPKRSAAATHTATRFALM
jgi:hypothetical protein